MKYEARVEITHLPGIADPQGATVERSLPALGYDNVSHVMEAVGRFAAAGGPVVGICNGFQVLTEAGLLPGALQKNAGLTFRCETVDCRVETSRSPLTALAAPGDVLRLPINHFEGNYA